MSEITYTVVKCGCSIYFSQFCNFDMSRNRYLEVFRESLGIRDNESRLYMIYGYDFLGLPVVRCTSSKYRYPLAEYTGSAEVEYGGDFVENPCSKDPFFSHDSLPYQPIYLTGSEDSFLELKLGLQTVVSGDWSFSMFVYSFAPHVGTIFHYLLDNEALPVGVTSETETSKLYLTEIKLELNGTHLLFTMLGAWKHDHGSAVIPSIVNTEAWIPLAVSHDKSSGEVLLVTDNNKFYQSSDYQDNTDNCLLAQPGKIKLGGSYNSPASPFHGSIVCFAIFDSKVSASSFSALLDECQPSNWVVTPPTGNHMINNIRKRSKVKSNKQNRRSV